MRQLVEEEAHGRRRGRHSQAGGRGGSAADAEDGGRQSRRRVPRWQTLLSQRERPNQDQSPLDKIPGEITLKRAWR